MLTCLWGNLSMLSKNKIQNFNEKLPYFGEYFPWKLFKGGNYSRAETRGWSPKFETGINIIIKSALYSIFWQDSITNIKINSFQIFWRLCDPFYWEYTKDLLGVYFGYTGGIFGLYLSYSGAILELYWGYLILGV